MRRCLYTVNVGGYDKPRPAPRLAGWDCLYFTDRPLPLLARLVTARGWTARVLEQEAETGATLSRKPKLLAHRYLPDYDYSLYIDANIVVRQDPTALLESLDWPVFLTAEHPYRATLGEEIEACVAETKAPPAAMRAQLGRYTAEGLPEAAPLYENNVLARRHNAPEAIRLAEAWWEAYTAHPTRDQLSLPYAAWRTGIGPTVLAQARKRSVFQAKAHDRSRLARLRRSLNKRGAALRGRR